MEENNIPKSNWLERLQKSNIEKANASTSIEAESKTNSEGEAQANNLSEPMSAVEAVTSELKERTKAVPTELEEINDNNSDGLSNQNDLDSSNKTTEGQGEDNTNTDIQDNNDALNDALSWLKEDGDNVESNVEQNTESAPDYLSISKALGFEAGTKEDFEAHYKDLNEKVANYEAQLKEQSSESVFANEQIAKANEISKNGGDWQAYLQLDQMDISSLSDDVIIAEFGLKPIFGDDEASINEAMNDLKPYQKKQEAYRLRQELENDKKAELLKMENASKQKKQMINDSIKNQIAQTDNLYGLKIDDKTKKEMYDNITSTDFINSIFYDDKGQINPKAIVETAFLVKNIKNIVKTNINLARNTATKEIFDEISQPQVKRQGTFASPTPKKPMNAMDKAYASLRGGK